jgi:hypothetical protein
MSGLIVSFCIIPDYQYYKKNPYSERKDIHNYFTFCEQINYLLWSNLGVSLSLNPSPRGEGLKEPCIINLPSWGIAVKLSF